MRNILIVTGLDSSEKLGGLERWYINLSKIINKDSKIFLFYNRKLPAEVIVNTFHSHQIYPMIFPFDEIKNRSSDFNYFLKNNQIDIVWAHFENTVSFLPYAKRLGLKTYWSLHMGNFYFVNKQWKKNWKLFIGTQLFRFDIFKILFSIDRVYCVSHGVLREYRNFFGHNKKFEVNYLGLEKGLLEENRNEIEKKRNDATQLIITCVAFHGHIKGVDIFIKAIAELNSRGYCYVQYFQIGGAQYLDGTNDTEELHNLANSLNIKNLNWMGLQKNVLPFLLKSDIYCQPSRHEALSFTTMEAMSVGLPIIASDTCGLPELVHDGQNGYLFTVENHMDLADKLELLIKDKDLRRVMGEQSLAIINQPKFNSEYNLDKILKDINKK